MFLPKAHGSLMLYAQVVSWFLSAHITVGVEVDLDVHYIVARPRLRAFTHTAAAPQRTAAHGNAVPTGSVGGPISKSCRESEISMLLSGSQQRAQQRAQHTSTGLRGSKLPAPEIGPDSGHPCLMNRLAKKVNAANGSLGPWSR